MEIVKASLAFMYGICIGSFLNVVIYRLPLGLNMVNSRSICPSCKTEIKPIHLIPVFSWIFLGGKCKYCKTKISIQYPAIELITGIIITLAYIQYGFTLTFFRLAIVFCILMVISVIDIYEQYIYDITTFTGLGVSIVFLLADYFINGNNIMTYFISAVVSFIIYYLIHVISKKMYGKEAFGMGDVLLAILIGINIPAGYLYFTVFLPFLLAGFVALLIYLNSKVRKKEFESMIPFGPFMAVACVILTLYGAYIPFQSLVF